jgi:hypothetical protein
MYCMMALALRSLRNFANTRRSRFRTECDNGAIDEVHGHVRDIRQCLEVSRAFLVFCYIAAEAVVDLLPWSVICYLCYLKGTDPCL